MCVSTVNFAFLHSWIRTAVSPLVRVDLSEVEGGVKLAAKVRMVVHDDVQNESLAQSLETTRRVRPPCVVEEIGNKSARWQH
jgi:hypothetical protein